MSMSGRPGADHAWVHSAGVALAECGGVHAGYGQTVSGGGHAGEYRGYTTGKQSHTAAAAAAAERDWQEWDEVGLHSR
jgi:hypothetical protein